MATTSNNNIVRSPCPNSIFEAAKNGISSAVSWNQGDLLFLDTTAHLIKPIATEATDALTFLGVARQSIVSGVLKSPYSGTAVDASQGASEIAGPAFGVEAQMQLKSGDSFVFGQKVYAVDAAPQTVASADPGSHAYVGIYVGPAVTAGASSFGAVRIVSQYPAVNA